MYNKMSDIHTLHSINDELSELNNIRIQQINDLTHRISSYLIQQKEKHPHEEPIQGCTNCGTKNQIIKQLLQLIKILRKANGGQQDKAGCQSQKQEKIRTNNEAHQSQENKLLKNEVKELQSKIQFLKQRIRTLEISNKSLHQQIVKSCRSRRNNLLLCTESNNKKFKNTSCMGKFECNFNRNPRVRNQKTEDSFISLLEGFQRNKMEEEKSKNIPHSPVNHKIKQETKQAKRLPSYLQHKNMIKNQKQFLDHKIVHLQTQNNDLRAKINRLHG